jgi:putative endonuclease
MATDSRKRIGRLGERLAADHLDRSGYRVLERNYRVREGEIDIVAARGDTLVFCEVKTLVARAGRAPALDPLEGVGPAKRAQVRRIARAWLAERSGVSRGWRDIRFDAIGVAVSPTGEPLALEHLRSAFG